MNTVQLQMTGSPGIAALIPGREEDDLGVMGIVELILKRRERLDRLIREPALAPQLVPRFLAIALAGFVLYGVAMAIVLGAARVWPHLTALPAVLQGNGDWPLLFSPAAGTTALSPWLDGSAWSLIAAY